MSQGTNNTKWRLRSRGLDTWENFDPSQLDHLTKAELRKRSPNISTRTSKNDLMMSQLGLNQMHTAQRTPPPIATQPPTSQVPSVSKALSGVNQQPGHSTKSPHTSIQRPRSRLGSSSMLDYLTYFIAMQAFVLTVTFLEISFQDALSDDVVVHFHAVRSVCQFVLIPILALTLTLTKRRSLSHAQ